MQQNRTTWVTYLQRSLSRSLSLCLSVDVYPTEFQSQVTAMKGFCIDLHGCGARAVPQRYRKLLSTVHVLQSFTEIYKKSLMHGWPLPRGHLHSLALCTMAHTETCVGEITWKEVIQAYGCSECLFNVSRKLRARARWPMKHWPTWVGHILKVVVC